MQLRRIAVRNFRKLASAVELDAIADGVTVIAGDNEEGKSTLLDAVRTGLFQRHNVTGKPVEDMQPFGSRVRPEVCVDFEAGGRSYRIEKIFGQKPSACLTTPDGRFEGPEAEEHLSRLLSFRVATRGASKADDWGVLGLFWLEQGSAADGLGMGETGRSTLRGALEDEVGDVLGGTAGRALLDAARQRRGELLTGTGRQRGELLDAVGAVEKAEAAVRELEQARSEYDREIDELDRVRRELARIDSDRVIEIARKALDTALAEAAAIDALRGEVASAVQSLGLAEANASNLADRWQQRRALVQAVTDAGHAADAARAEHARLDADSGAVAQRLCRADEQMAAASALRERHERRLAQADAQARIVRLERDTRALRDTLERVESLAAERAAARRALGALPVDQAAFDELQRLDTRVREARAALDAVATRLRFLPAGAQQVHRDGVVIAAGEPVEITGEARFTLDGFGAMEVRPGASEIEHRQRQHAAAARALASALGRSGAATLDAARELVARRATAEATVKETGRLIDAHARDGEKALRDAVRDAEDALARLRAELDPGAGDPPGDLERERERTTAARAAETAARDALEAARLAHQDHASRIAAARRELEATARSSRDAAARLDTARGSVSDADLALALESARAALARARTAERDVRARLAAADPEATGLRRRRAEAALAEAERERARLRDEAIALESRLSALGRDGLAERLEDARGVLERAVARREQLLGESAAWDLLVATLERAEREAKEAFLEPVLAQVEPFLQLILPGARVSLDEETLEITGVTRDGRHEPYQSLSVGTREQIAILVRLAFAVYLRGKQFPAAVILDDALVYADDDRFERMQLALLKAAESVQILILTCRPRDWRQFGAPIRRLAAAAGKGGGC